MGWFSFILGIIVGGLGTCLWLVLIELKNDEDVLDSEAEYVDNTPTFQ